MNLASTVLFVKEMGPMAAFYSKVIGMDTELDLGSYVVFTGGIALWQPGEGHSITKNLVTIDSSNRFELYFENDDIPALCEKLETAGAEFLHKVHEEPWGQLTIRFFDPERNLIEAGEPPSAFVRRMHNSGMSIEQISDKTGMHDTAVEVLLGMPNVI